jgi:hypothetical protein
MVQNVILLRYSESLLHTAWNCQDSSYKILYSISSTKGAERSMDNFCSALYFVFEHEYFMMLLTACVRASRTINHAKHQHYRDMSASNGWQSDGSAVSNVQAWVNKFLAGRSKDKLDSMRINIYTLTFERLNFHVPQLDNAHCHPYLNMSYSTVFVPRTTGCGRWGETRIILE